MSEEAERNTRKEPATQPDMGQRCYEHDYSQAGLYHITMTVAEKEAQPLGCVKGNATAAPGEDDTPHVALSPIGKMVEEELTRSLPRHYL